MCGFIYSSEEFVDLENSNEFCSRRGPDITNVIKIERTGHSFLHNLLSITGKKTTQPLVQDGVYCVYNGQIYNYNDFGSEYDSDGKCLIPLYKEMGFDFVKELDGEFALVLLDLNKDILFLSTDIFSTKPLWIGRRSDGAIGASSYQSSLRSENYGKISQVPPNTSLLIDIKSKTLLETREVHTFDLNQHKTSYDDWNLAFEESIKKRTRTREKIFIGLSGGYDSGAIACELLKQGTDFKSFSIAADEDIRIIRSRMEKINNTKFTNLGKQEFYEQKSFLERVSEMYSTPGRAHRPGGYIVTNDKGAIGTGIICKQAREEGYKIYLSGQGSDEIISDYGHGGKMAQGFIHGDLAGVYPKDLSKVFPWTNFFLGTQKEFLYKDEAVGGAYGIECRYPFLDKKLVQEFLWLDVELKNKYYKAPLNNYLKINNFPFREGLTNKVGFRANKFKQERGM